jgi:hypothetical protein
MVKITSLTVYKIHGLPESGRLEECNCGTASPYYNYEKITQRAFFTRLEPLLSPIRTITVGPGITPDLLTSNWKV